MPELPEVEVIKRQLFNKVVGKTIKKVEVLVPTVIKNINPDNFIKELRNKKIINLKRRAKYLIFELSSKKIFLVHLGMTGALIYGDKGQKYIKFILTLNDGHKIYYCDSRMFGKIRIVENLDIIKHLGPEPLENNINAKIFYQMLQAHQSKIKPLLLDQKFIAGIGNIYACEALFYAKINPNKKANQISFKTTAKLLEGIKKVLSKSIIQGGSSVDRYVDAAGEKGKMQLHLKVYDREGGKCVRCNKIIKRVAIAQRGTYYCPNCQK